MANIKKLTVQKTVILQNRETMILKYCLLVYFAMYQWKGVTNKSRLTDLLNICTGFFSHSISHLKQVLQLEIELFPTINTNKKAPSVVQLPHLFPVFAQVGLPFSGMHDCGLQRNLV